VGAGGPDHLPARARWGAERLRSPVRHARWVPLPGVDRREDVSGGDA
jgi:hypothetical protein